MDEKDRLIVHLKTEVNTLKQSEREYADLNFLLTNLEHRYNLLNEEKLRIELEFKTRNETNMQTIAMHRSDIDQLRDDLQGSLTTATRIRKLLEDKEYENQVLIEENEQLQMFEGQMEKENKALVSKVEYCQNYIHELQIIKQKQEQEIMDNMDQNNEAQFQLEDIKNEHFEFKNYKESSQEENRTLKLQNAKLDQEVQRLDYKLKKQSNEFIQLTHLNKESEAELIQQLKEQIETQSKINNQLVQNNEHFQTKIDSLIQENQSLKLKLEEQQQHHKHQSLMSKEADINRSQIQEVLKLSANLKTQLEQKELILQDLHTDKRILQQKLDMLEDVLSQTKRQQSYLKEELLQQEDIRKQKLIQDQRVFELERDLVVARQGQQLLEISFEKQRVKSQQIDENNQSKITLEALEREYQILMKSNQGEISRLRETQFQLDCKDRELNRTIQKIQEQEIEIRSIKQVVGENENLKTLIQQQAQQINKYIEEGMIIKEYIRRKQHVREDRINNERQIQKTLDEIVNLK